MAAVIFCGYSEEGDITEVWLEIMPMIFMKFKEMWEYLNSPDGGKKD